MKSANAYGRPSSAAQIADCADEPSSHGLGRLRAAGQHPGQARERVLGGQVVLDVGEQLGELLGEVVGHRPAAVALQRERGQGVGARRAAEGQVDAARETARRGG